MGKGGREFMLSGDGPPYAKQRSTMHNALYHDDWHKHVKVFYEDITQKLLVSRSYKIAGRNQVDMIRDVSNIAHVYFAANVFSLPLKTENHVHGIYTEHELYMVLAVLFTVIFFDIDPAKSFPLRQVGYTLSQQIGKLVEANVKAVDATGLVAGVADPIFQNHDALKDYGVHMVRRLLESGLSTYDVAWSQILPTAGAMVANQGQVVSFLSPPISLKLKVPC
jgi:linoleate 10R-lipoxygenase